MDIRNEKIESECFYHIYNRGINGCLIFKNEENYSFFLKKFELYLDKYCDIYSYCLMPNHFHFLIKAKSEDELKKLILINNNLKSISNMGLHSPINIVSKQLGKFISSYSQAYNKVHKRHGPLLESPFKRIKVDTLDYLKNLILYIHLNPVDIGIDYDIYKFSSYNSVVSKNKTKIKREEILELFDNEENFMNCHRIYHQKNRK